YIDRTGCPETEPRCGLQAVRFRSRFSHQEAAGFWLLSRRRCPHRPYRWHRCRNGSPASFGLAVQGVKEVWGFFADIVGQPLQLAANLERTKTSMVGLAGSVEGADKLIEDLRQMAGKSGGLFNLDDLTQASRGMLAVGFNTEQTVASLKMIAD